MKTKKNRIFILAFIISSVIFAASFDYSGYTNVYAINKTSNGSMIKLPFRLLNYDFSISELNQYDSFVIHAKWGVEHKIKSFNSHASFPSMLYDLTSSKNVDYSSKFRELYISIFGPNYEIKLGKQIHSWGTVDVNSPLDFLNPTDYYYLFTDIDETKIGRISLMFDFYLDQFQFQLLAMPYHKPNNIPSNDPNFPITLPATVNDYQFLAQDEMFEWGGYARTSTGTGEFTLYYFSGYDRNFNLYGANVFLDDFDINSVTDTVFSYRQTDMLGISGVKFIDDFTIRFDFGYFKSNTDSISIESRAYSGKDPISEFLDFNTLAATSYFDISGEYHQYNLQVEFPTLPYDINLTTQLFNYRKYKVNGNIVDIELTNFEIYLDGSDFFYPGMGSSLATLCERAFIINLDKTFFDDSMELQFSRLTDLKDKGHLDQLKFSYDLLDDLNLSFLFYKGKGNKIKYPDNPETETIDESLLYPFNGMADFSHIRAQLKYFF